MYERMDMKLGILVFAFLLIGPISCQSSKEPITKQAEWTDGQARFLLSVTEGTATLSFVAEILISNTTDKPLSFPTPYVMPLCGNTNKNNIRVLDQNGKALEMTGVHVDFFGRSATEIPAGSSKSWRFELDRSFPEMAKPGIYSVEMWYFSDKNDQATWKGRVKMKGLTVVRKDALETKEAHNK